MPLNSVSTASIDLETFDLDEALAAAAEEPLCKFAAWKNFVSSLPAVLDVTKEDVCSVCMESFEDSHNSEEGGNKRVPCGHVYHSNCITLWLHRCSSCPLCRRHISF
ncbi:anaphase-promoting complex subunit 11 RING-H2 finger protein [Medicago truncatula]|uniref:RING-type E3 ubiquitin transferase n=1 Tax=Medicago truncatula TaxID=3880 RepID=G7L7G6_MEDTR|nr:anaphase-promoting complex subunit 11 RING-H2 finger protein [Medicago truncatula]